MVSTLVGCSGSSKPTGHRERCTGNPRKEGKGSIKFKGRVVRVVLIGGGTFQLRKEEGEGFTLLAYKRNTVQAEGPVSAKAPRPRCVRFEEWWRGRCD